MITITSSIFLLFLTSLLVQLGYWWLIFSALAKQPKKSIVPNIDPFISIIAVFKNPKQEIYALLDKLRRQEYNSTEVILMDDYSEHSSVDPQQYPEFRFFAPTENVPGKKKALTEAIYHALGDYILVTDADCIPSSTNWASRMAAYVSGPVQIVLGYSPYMKRKGFLNAFIRFESWLVGIQYLSYALRGMPYMGVGRNMLYQKKLFLDTNPFDTYPNLLSGDDDLFIHAAATQENTTICIEPDTFVYSVPKASWAAYFQQKKRHISTASTYKTKIVLLLSLFSLSQILSVFTFFFLVCSTYWLTTISIYILYMITKWIVARRLMNTLQEDDLILLFPILDVVYTLFIVVLSPFLLFKSKKW